MITPQYSSAAPVRTSSVCGTARPTACAVPVHDIPCLRIVAAEKNGTTAELLLEIEYPETARFQLRSVSLSFLLNDQLGATKSSRTSGLFQIAREFSKLHYIPVRHTPSSSYYAALRSCAAPPYDPIRITFRRPTLAQAVQKKAGFQCHHRH